MSCGKIILAVWLLHLQLMEPAMEGLWVHLADGVTTSVLGSFAGHVVVFCDVRVNVRDQTIEVKVRIHVVEMGHCSKHKAMLLCCICVSVGMLVLHGFTPHDVAYFH